MNKETILNQRNYIPWIDVVRAIAILGVILCHVVDTAMAFPPKSDIVSFTFWTEIFKTLSRPSVALFVLITGFLLLPVNTDSISFYRKRLTRIIYPFIIWSVIYNLLPWVLSFLHDDLSVVKIVFPYYENQNPSLSDSLMGIATIPFTFNILTYPLWYVYMLVGLYFMMPIISPWIKKASEKEYKIVLILWIISLFIPYVHTFCIPYIFGEAEWNEFGMLYYFSGFSGYLLAGSIIKTSEKIPLKTKLWLSLPLFCIATWGTYEGYHFMMSNPEVTPEGMELFFMFCTPNVMAMTFAIFAMASRVHVASEKMIRILKTLSACGFGIYMVHYLFIGPIDFFLKQMSFPIWLHIPVCTIAVFAVAWVFIYCIKKMPFSKYITG